MNGGAVTGSARDWAKWHRHYDDPDSMLTERLRIVQDLLRTAITTAPEGRVRILSAGAGQGNDVLGVLPDHPRRDDVDALLVELDPRNVEVARKNASSAGLGSVRIDHADGGVAGAYEAIVPAHILCICGIFGNIPNAHGARTVLELRTLCAPGALVIWTDVFDPYPRWFEAAGFREEASFAPEGSECTIAMHRLAEPPLPFVRDAALFQFRQA